MGGIITLADVIEVAAKAGTLPMQVLLLLAIIVLGWAMRYMHNENKAAQKSWVDRMDVKDASMTTERINRINMLMSLVRDNAETNGKLVGAVDNNTNAINDLKDFIREHTQIIKQQTDLFQQLIQKL